MKRIRKITRHTLKFFIIPLVILVAVCVGSASALFYFYPKDKVLAIVTSTAEKTLKRKVTAGDIRYSLGGVRLSNVVILNSMDPADSALIKIGRLGLRFDLWSIITSRFEIKHLQIDDMDLVLSYDGTKWNLEALLNDLKSDAAQKRKDRKQKKKSADTSSTLNTIGFDNASITLESSPAVIKPLVGKYRFNGIVDISSPDEVLVKKFLVELPERRGEIESAAVKIFPLDADFAVTGDVQLNGASMNWLYRWGGLDFLPYSEVTGKINSLSVTSRGLSGNIIGTTRLKNRAAVNLNGAFKAGFRPFSLTISDAAVTTGGSSVYLKVLTVGRGTLPSFTAEKIDAQLEEIGPVIPFFPPVLYGHVEGNVVSDRLVFTGKITAKDVGVDREKKLVSGFSGTFDVTKNSFRAENIPVRIMSNDAVISAAAPEDFMKDIAVNLKIAYLDLSPKSAAENGGKKTDSGTNGETASAPESVSIPALPLRLRGAVEIGQLRKNGYDLRNIETVYECAGKKLSVPRYRFSMLDAQVTGSANVELSSSPLVETKVSIDELKVQNISSIYKQFEGRIYGNAKARLSLSFRPAEKNAIDTVTGSCEFAVTGGKVANTGIQNALGIWLDSLKYKLKDLEFNTISGSVAVDRGNVDIKSLIFNSPDVRVMVDGEILKRTELSAKLVLEFNSNFIQDIPNPAVALIQINGYKKGKWYTIPRQVKGNIPEGKYDTSEIK